MDSEEKMRSQYKCENQSENATIPAIKKLIEYGRMDDGMNG
jgi:hypothetical protein